MFYKLSDDTDMTPVSFEMWVLKTFLDQNRLLPIGRFQNKISKIFLDRFVEN